MAQTFNYGRLRFYFRGDYDNTVAYQFNDVVKYQNTLYVVIQKTGTATGVVPTTSATWGNMLPASSVVITGTLASRPTTFTGNRFYAVVGDTTASNNGVLYYDTGSAWVQLGGSAYLTGTLANRPSTFTGNRVYIVTGDTASNNGLAYLDTGSAWLAFGGSTSSGTTAEPRKVFAYDTSGNLSTVTVTSADGATTLSTTTLNYDTSGNLTSTVLVSGGVTTTRTFTYDASGNTSLVTEVKS